MGRKDEKKMQEVKHKKNKDLSQINTYSKNAKSKQAKEMHGSNPKCQKDKSDSSKSDSSLSTDNLFKTVSSTKNIHVSRSKNLIKMLYSKLDEVQKRKRRTSFSANSVSSTISQKALNTSISHDSLQKKTNLDANKTLHEESLNSSSSSSSSKYSMLSDILQVRKNLKQNALSMQESGILDSSTDSNASLPSEHSERIKGLKRKYFEAQQEEIDSQLLFSISSKLSKKGKCSQNEMHEKEEPSSKYTTTCSPKSKGKRKSLKIESLKEPRLRKELSSGSRKYLSSTNSNILSEKKSIVSIFIEEAQQIKELDCGSTNPTSPRCDFMKKENGIKRKDIEELLKKKEPDSESQKYATSISSHIPSDLPQGRESLKRKGFDKSTLSISLEKYSIPLKIKSFKMQDKKRFYDIGSSQSKMDNDKKVQIHAFSTSKIEKSLETECKSLQHSKETLILHKSLCEINKVKSIQSVSNKIPSYPHEAKAKIDCLNHFTTSSLKSKEDEPSHKRCDDIALSEQNMDIDNIDMNNIESNLNNDGLQNQAIVVLDTNVLLRDRSVIEDLRATMFFGKNMKIIIPFVVLQELDKLKLSKEKTLKGDAEAAIKWCNNYLENHDPCIQGHKNYEFFLNSLNFYDKNVDNIILQCCISFCKEDKIVYLISDDINLRNKALSFNLKSFNLKKLKNLIQPQDIETLPLNIECMNKVSSEKTTNSSVSVNKPEKLPDSLICINEPVQPSKTDIKDSIVTCLGGILEYAMKDAYHDLWESIVLFKPPWSAIQVLKCFEKHWIALFIDKFSQDIKTRITEIHKDLESSCQINLYEKLLNLYRLFQHEPYKSIVNKSLKSIKEIANNCSLTEVQETPFDHIQEMMLTIGRDASSKIQEMSRFLQEGYAKEADISLNEVNNSLLLLRKTLISFGHLLFGFNEGTCDAPPTVLNQHMNQYWKLAGIDVPTVDFKQPELIRFLTSVEGKKFIQLYLAEVEKLIRIIDEIENH